MRARCAAVLLFAAVVVPTWSLPMRDSDDPLQRAALTRLYNATGGDHWTNRSGWLSRASYCTWHGVGCSNHNVTSISLKANGLSGVVPHIPELRYLLSFGILENNFASQDIPDDFWGLPPTLRSLWL